MNPEFRTQPPPGGRFPIDPSAKAWAIGYRVTAFDVTNALGPGATVMPFDSHVAGGGMVVDNATGTINTPGVGIYLAVAFYSYAPAMMAGTTVDRTIISNDGTVTWRRGEDRVSTTPQTSIGTTSALWLSTGSEIVRLAIGQNTGGTVSSGVGNPSLPWYLAVYQLA